MLSALYAGLLNVAFLLSALGIGAPLVARLGMKREEMDSFLLFGISVGMGALSLLTLAAGALRLFHTWTAVTLIFAGVLCGLLELALHLTSYKTLVRRALAAVKKQPSIWSAALLALLCLNLIYPLISYGLIPPVMGDEVAYHLAIPKIYIHFGGIAYIPFIPYSNWPLGTEMLYTLGLLLRSETLAHLITWDSLLLICAGLGWFARRFLVEHESLLPAVLFAATPMVGTLAGTALIELPLALFTYLAAASAIVWTEKRQAHWWVVSAICGGFAASTKLNAALVPLILGTLLLGHGVLTAPRQWWKAVKQFAAYGCIALIVVLPWYVKSWLFAGNPFWPFFMEYFGARNWDALGNEYLLGFIQLVNLPITLRNWFSGLPRLVLQPRQFAPVGVDLIWYYLVLPLLALPPLIVWRGSRRRVLAWLCVITLALYTTWFFETQQARFLLSTTPLICLVMAAGVEWLMHGHGKPVEVLVGATLVLSILGTGWLFDEDDRALLRTRWSFLTGAQTREDFLSANVPGYTVFDYANSSLPKNSLVWLALYEVRGYYLDRDYVWANPISQRLFQLERYADASALAADLRARGFTHMLFAPNKLARYEYIRYGPQLTRLARDLRAEHCLVQFETPDLTLCKLE